MPDKRRAILGGARRVFAREGYPRASIEAISAEAAVSTRTIYNHFRDKAELFRIVIQESAAGFAEAQLALIEQHRRGPSPRDADDVERTLVGFARQWVGPRPGYDDHLALVRRIEAEAGHVPQAAIDAWQAAGPRRVRRALASWLEELGERGALTVDDPERAAAHFARLVAVTVLSEHRTGAGEEEILDVVRSGVHAFLYGYAPRRSPE
jgi:AcrR family transcriptional regulator